MSTRAKKRRHGWGKAKIGRPRKYKSAADKRRRRQVENHDYYCRRQRFRCLQDKDRSLFVDEGLAKDAQADSCELEFASDDDDSDEETHDDEGSVGDTVAEGNDFVPITKRMFDIREFQVSARLHLLCSILYLAFVSNCMTQKVLKMMFVVGQIVSEMFGDSGCTVNRFQSILEHYRKEMFGECRKHYYCHDCKNLVPDVCVEQNEFVCACGLRFEKKYNFFSTLSIRRALTTFLETTARNPKLFIPTTVQLADGYGAGGGEAMRRLSLRNTDCYRDFAVDLFIDNAQLTKTSKKSSTTLVQISVANCWPHVSRNRIMLVALWYARRAEDACPYNIILSVVVDELLDLLRNPIVWRNGEKVVETRVMLRSVIADMKAKAYVLGVKQSGYYSCPYCLHEGTVMQSYRKKRVVAQRGTRKQVTHDRVQANYASSPAVSQVSGRLFVNDCCWVASFQLTLDNVTCTGGRQLSRTKARRPECYRNFSIRARGVSTDEKGISTLASV